MAEERYNFDDFFNKESFELGIRELEGFLAGLLNELKKFDNAFLESSKANATALKELNKQIKASASALNKLTASNTKAVEKSEELTKSILERAEAIKKLQDAEAKGLQNSKELRKQLTALQKELSKLKAEAKAGQTPLDGLNEKLKQVGENTESIKGGNSLKELKARLKELKAEAEGLDLSTEEGKQAFAELAAEGRSLDDQIKTLQRSFRNFSKTSEELGDTYKGQSKRLNELRQQYKNLAVQNKANTKEAKDLLAEIQKLDTKLKDIDNSVGQNQRSVGNYKNALLGLKEGFSSGLGGAAALGGGVAGLAAAFAEFSVQLVQDTIQDLKEFNKVLAESENFFRGSKKQAIEFASVAKAAGTVFGTDAANNLQTLKIATDQFKASSEEATNALNTGLALAGSQAPQVAETFNTFGSNIARAGFSFSEASIILGSAVSKGAKDVDKAGDLINNAIIEVQRLKPEDLKGILPAEQFNEFNKVLANVQNGTEPARNAIAKTIDIVNELGFESTASGELISKVFTAVGEEGVSPEFLKFLGEASKGTKDFTANLTDKQKALIELSESTAESNRQLSRLSNSFGAGNQKLAILGQQIKANILEVLADFAERASLLFDNLEAVFSVFDSSEAQAIGTFFKDLLSRVVELSGGFVNQFLTVENLTDGFAVLVSALKGAKAAALVVFDAFRPLFDLLDSIDLTSLSDGFNQAFKDIADASLELIDFLQPVFEGITDIFLAPFEGIFQGIKAIFPELDLPDSLKEVASEAVDSFTTEFSKTKANIEKELALKEIARAKAKEAEEAGETLGNEVGKGVVKGATNEVKKGTSEINKELVKLKQDAELALAGGSDSESGLALLFAREKEALQNQKEFKLLTTEEQNALLLQIESKYQNDLQALREAKANEQIQKEKEKNDAILNQLQDFNNIAVGIVEKEAAEEIAILQEKRAKGLITEKQLQDGIKMIKEAAANELLNIEIENLKAQLSEAELNKEERLRIEKEIADKKAEISATNLAREKQDAEKSEEIQKSRLEKLAQGLEFSAGIAGSLFDIRSNFREKELQDLDEQKQNELALAGDNAEKRENIEKRFAAKQAEIKRKQAIQDKAAALFQIALNTAAGVARAIAASPVTFGLPFSAFVAASGAAQLAVVASKPIPRFHKGTEYVNLNGNPKGIDTVPALVNEGERIVPTNINKQIPNLPNSALPEVIEKGLNYDSAIQSLQVALNQKGLESALASRTIHQTNITEQGIFAVTKTRTSTIKRIQKRFK